MSDARAEMPARAADQGQPEVMLSDPLESPQGGHLSDARADQGQPEAMPSGHPEGPHDEPLADGAGEERITLRMPVHLAKPSGRMVLRGGPRPVRPRGRLLRAARLLALAHHFQDLLDRGVVRSQSELAELTRVTRARITQIMNLLVLAPDIQEELLFWPPITRGRPPVTERQLRPLLQTLVWSEQRVHWAEIRRAYEDGTPAPKEPTP
jgi:hypothetical protein